MRLGVWIVTVWALGLGGVEASELETRLEGLQAAPVVARIEARDPALSSRAARGKLGPRDLPKLVHALGEPSLPVVDAALRDRSRRWRRAGVEALLELPAAGRAWEDATRADSGARDAGGDGFSFEEEGQPGALAFDDDTIRWTLPRTLVDGALQCVTDSGRDGAARGLVKEPVRGRLTRLLGQLPGAHVTEALRALLADANPAVRAEAAEALEPRPGPHPPTAAALIALLEREGAPTPSMLQAAAWGAGPQDPRAAAYYALLALAKRAPQAVGQAAEGVRDEAVRAALGELLAEAAR